MINSRSDYNLIVVHMYIMDFKYAKYVKKIKNCHIFMIKTIKKGKFSSFFAGYSMISWR